MSSRPNPSIPPVGDFLSEPWESRTTRLAHRRMRSSVAVVRARGHIDASNADTLTEYILGHLTGCRGLIIDLRGLDFFGTEGFSALHRVSVCCAHPGIAWAVVPSGAVSRVLLIGDPEGFPTRRKHRRGGDGDHPRPATPSTAPIASRREPGQSSRRQRTVCLVCGGTG
jgi:anti-anti-sigma factor